MIVLPLSFLENSVEQVKRKWILSAFQHKECAWFLSMKQELLKYIEEAYVALDSYLGFWDRSLVIKRGEKIHHFANLRLYLIIIKVCPFFVLVEVFHFSEWGVEAIVKMFLSNFLWALEIQQLNRGDTLIFEVIVLGKGGVFCRNDYSNVEQLYFEDITFAG